MPRVALRIPRCMAVLQELHAPKVVPRILAHLGLCLHVSSNVIFVMCMSHLVTCDSYSYSTFVVQATSKQWWSHQDVLEFIPRRTRGEPSSEFAVVSRANKKQVYNTCRCLYINNAHRNSRTARWPLPTYLCAVGETSDQVQEEQASLSWLLPTEQMYLCCL